MNISRRAKSLPASSIRKLVPYSDAAKDRGIHVYHLNIGQPDIQTPDTFLDAVKKYDEKVLAYGPSNGILQYRKALQIYYKRCGIALSLDEIFVTIAGSEALMFAYLAVADPGESIMVMEPFYANYSGFAAMTGLEVIGVPSTAETGFAVPPIEEFEKRLRPNTRAIVICNPNNPTGAVYPDSSLNALAEFALANDLFVISDEVYREFVYDGSRHTSIMDLPALGDRAIMVDSVSKRYSACGARIGCIVTHNQAVLSAVMKMGQARLCPPTLEQIGAAAAVETPDSYMQEVIREYQNRRDILLNGLNSIEGVYCVKPEGAFYMMVTLPVKNTDHFAKFMLEDFQYDNETVMVAPGAGFYATPDIGRNQVRMAYVLKKEDLLTSIEILRRGLQAYKER